MLKNDAHKCYSIEIDGFNLVYKLLRSFGKSGCQYGVQIIMLKNDEVISKATLNDIFCSENAANAFFDAVCQGAVTPETLVDIAEEWLE